MLLSAYKVMISQDMRPIKYAEKQWNDKGSVYTKIS